jgi:hypothetical protein
MQKEQKLLNDEGGHGSLEMPQGRDMKLMMMATQPFLTYGLVFCFTLDPTIVNSYVMD